MFNLVADCSMARQDPASPFALDIALRWLCLYVRHMSRLRRSRFLIRNFGPLPRCP